MGAAKGKEDSYYKHTKVTDAGKILNPLDFHKTYWPCVRISNVDKFCIPVRPEFHARLFPEADQKLQKQLTFGFDSFPQSSGNAIRKIYICHAPLKSMKPGSLLLFYRSGDSVITSVGVLEGYVAADSYEALIRIAGTRSVYSSDELLDMTGGKKVAKAVNFYYAENFIKPIPLKYLVKHRVLKSGPQSIMSLSNECFDVLFSKLLDEKDRAVFYK